MVDVAAVVCGLAIGSIVWGVLLGRLLFGRDPRTADNPGASGSFRLFGPGFGIAVGLLDLAKGYAAIWLARNLGASEMGLSLTAMAVVAGHNWPVWFGFRGGGGLATAAGALSALGLTTTLWGIAIALSAAAVYKHPRLYRRLPMTALPFGALVGLPVVVELFRRSGNYAGATAAVGATVLIGCRGLQMLRTARSRET
jgi:acyl phosphate:glycerol-3-phosphate acyltransferase